MLGLYKEPLSDEVDVPPCCTCADLSMLVVLLFKSLHPTHLTNTRAPQIQTKATTKVTFLHPPLTIIFLLPSPNPTQGPSGADKNNDKGDTSDASIFLPNTGPLRYRQRCR